MEMKMLAGLRKLHFWVLGKGSDGTKANRKKRDAHNNYTTLENLFASALLTTPKPLTVWITANCGKFFKRWEYQTTSPVSWEICMQVKKQHLEPDMEQETGSKSGKEYVKLYIVILLIYLICRVHHAKCRAGWSTSWNQDCREKYQ